MTCSGASHRRFAPESILGSGLGLGLPVRSRQADAHQRPLDAHVDHDVRVIWYLERYVGVAGAVILSSILFGIGHIYQGRRQAFKIIFLGLLLALFYVGSGSLWIPIALHAALDAAQGRLAHRLRDEDL